MISAEFWIFITIFLAMGLFLLSLIILIKKIEKMSIQIECMRKGYLNLVKEKNYDRKVIKSLIERVTLLEQFEDKIRGRG